MPQYMIAIESGLNEADYKAAAKHIKDQGGKILHTFERDKVAPGYLVEFPADSVNTLQSYPHVMTIEPHGTASIQKTV